jgi:hypothetical protein
MSWTARRNEASTGPMLKLSRYLMLIEIEFRQGDGLFC